MYFSLIVGRLFFILNNKKGGSVQLKTFHTLKSRFSRGFKIKLLRCFVVIFYGTHFDLHNVALIIFR